MASSDPSKDNNPGAPRSQANSARNSRRPGKSNPNPAPQSQSQESGAEPPPKQPNASPPGSMPRGAGTPQQAARNRWQGRQKLKEQQMNKLEQLGDMARGFRQREGMDSVGGPSNNTNDWGRRADPPPGSDEDEGENYEQRKMLDELQEEVEQEIEGEEDPNAARDANEDMGGLDIDEGIRSAHEGVADDDWMDEEEAPPNATAKSKGHKGDESRKKHEDKVQEMHQKLTQQQQQQQGEGTSRKGKGVRGSASKKAGGRGAVQDAGRGVGAKGPGRTSDRGGGNAGGGSDPWSSNNDDADEGWPKFGVSRQEIRACNTLDSLTELLERHARDPAFSPANVATALTCWNQLFQGLPEVAI
eukprot:gene19896-26599_t